MNSVLKEACDNLKDIKATWEYPGYISVPVDFHRYLEIGDVNGSFDFDYMYTHECAPRYSDSILPLTATPKELELAIRKLVNGE